MGDEDDRQVAGQSVERVLEGFSRGVAQGTGRLVEDEHRRAFGERPRDAEALPPPPERRSPYALTLVAHPCDSEATKR